MAGFDMEEYEPDSPYSKIMMDLHDKHIANAQGWEVLAKCVDFCMKHKLLSEKQQSAVWKLLVDDIL